jgi:hypothetical protein
MQLEVPMVEEDLRSLFFGYGALKLTEFIFTNTSELLDAVALALPSFSKSAAIAWGFPFTPTDYLVLVLHHISHNLPHYILFHFVLKESCFV